jgi:hypothetical protein
MSVADSCLGAHSDATFARENLIVHDPRGMVHPLNAFRHPRSYARRRVPGAADQPQLVTIGESE